MRILLIGPRAPENTEVNGPTSAFQALVSGFQKANIHATAFPQGKHNKIFLYLRLCVLLLRRWDIINVHLSANFGIVVRLFRIWSRSLVLTVHGYSKLEQTGSRYNQWMHALQVKWMFPRCVYVSDHIRRRVEELEHLHGGVVIRNAVDVTQMWERASPIPVTHEIDVFSLCGFSATKGVNVLLRALEGNDTIASCVIAGHHEEMLPVVPLAHHLRGRISLIGAITPQNVLRLYRKSRVYVQPSMYESFGIPVVEALALGVPVVVSKGAGVAEFLSHGVDCLLVEPGDSHALGAAIRRLLEDEDLYETVARNGRTTSLRFLPTEIAKEYVSLFEQLISTDQ